jgi:hypothetical protein
MAQAEQRLARIDQAPRVARIDRLEGQLTFLAQGQHTVRRLIDLATERLETAWDDLTPGDIGELESWLVSRSDAARGEVQIRWVFVRGVFAAIREAHGPADPSPAAAGASF